MVDKANCLLAVYAPANPMRCDAATMVKLAQKKEIPITFIIPDTGKVEHS